MSKSGLKHSLKTLNVGDCGGVSKIYAEDELSRESMPNVTVEEEINDSLKD